MKKIITASLIAILSTSGCATIVRGPKQDLRIDTKDANGKVITNSSCYINGEPEPYKTGEKLRVGKNYTDMKIICRSPSQNAPAKATVGASYNNLAFGNILLLLAGPIGFGVDFVSGSMFDYPQWVQLVYGRDLSFDRESGTGEHGPVEPSSRYTGTAFDSYIH